MEQVEVKTETKRNQKPLIRPLGVNVSKDGKWLKIDLGIGTILLSTERLRDLIK